MEGYGKENRMGTRRKEGPPPAVRRIYESGNPKAIAVLQTNAAEARRRKAEEERTAKKREQDFADTVQDELRLREEEEIAQRLKENGEDVIPLETYD